MLNLKLNVFLKKVENRFDIPNGLLVNIATLSVSTVRGILFEKLKGTIVEKEVYPLIDITTMFKNLKNN